MSKVTFVVEGKPFGKKSVRTTMRGWSYMPKENKEYKDKVIAAYNEKHKGFKFDGKKPLYVEITAKFPIPDSTTLKNKALMISGKIMPTVKPDSDNIVKMVLDSLNGVCFEDDKQVVLHVCRKQYGIRPEVIVFVSDELIIN